jgi:hypothetical protein
LSSWYLIDHGVACALSDTSCSLDIEDSIFLLINTVLIFDNLNLRALIIFHVRDMLLQSILIDLKSWRDDLRILILWTILSRNAGFLILVILI